MGLYSLALLILLTWGVLAFGAEYAWAYAPLLVFAATVAVLELRASRGVPLPNKRLLAALLIVIGAAAMQLVPLPRALRSTIDPSAESVDYRQLYAASVQSTVDEGAASAYLPLSIAPGRTRLGLIFMVVFVVLFMAITRGVSAHGIAPVIGGISVLAVIVCVVALAQKSAGGALVYGFWYPPKETTPSAPFLNRNHFSGWVLMAMSLSIGLLGSIASVERTRLAPGWRRRLVWMASVEASQVVLLGFAILVMALSVVSMGSRSGLVGLAVCLLLSGWATMRRAGSRARSLAAGAYVGIVSAVAVFVGHIAPVLSRFGDIGSDDRLRAWSDAVRIIRAFPLVGTGWNTFGIAMLHFQTVPGAQAFIESHCDYLQVFAEGGLLIGIPAIVAVICFVREVRERFRDGDDDTETHWIRVGAVIGLCAIATQEAVDFTLQMPGAAVMFVVLLAIAIHKPDYLRRRSAAADLA